MAADTGGVLAIGGHAADMELTVGMLMARYADEGHRATFLHLTLGERGHARLDAAAYAAEKRRAAEQVAAALGAEARCLAYPDGELPDTDAVKLEVADIIREVRPRVIITNWRGSFHRDHRRAHHIAVEARFLAGLAWLERARPAVWVPHLLFAENWEDMEGFRPDVYFDTTTTYERWVDAMNHYEIWRDPTAGGFRYRDYYTALAQMRGCLSGHERAVALMRPDEDVIVRSGQLLT
jgi:LmbE family N-acetylglucosaminyl deacetylase